MNVVWWFAGVLAAITGLKFVLAVFRRIGSKSNLESLIDRAEEGISNGANKVADRLKKRKEEKHETEKPIVTIH